MPKKERIFENRSSPLQQVVPISCNAEKSRSGASSCIDAQINKKRLCWSFPTHPDVGSLLLVLVGFIFGCSSIFVAEAVGAVRQGPAASRPDDAPGAHARRPVVVSIGRGPRATGVAPPLLSLSLCLASRSRHRSYKFCGGVFGMKNGKEDEPRKMR